VGVLEFAKTRSSRNSDMSINVPVSFKGRVKVEKLVIIELDVTAESGITLENSRGEQIVIVAGANPHTLMVRAPSYVNSFEPEYTLDRYQRVIMT
jgi:hypothetical protein